MWLSQTTFLLVNLPRSNRSCILGGAPSCGSLPEEVRCPTNLLFWSWSIPKTKKVDAHHFRALVRGKSTGHSKFSHAKTLASSHFVTSIRRHFSRLYHKQSPSYLHSMVDWILPLGFPCLISQFLYLPYLHGFSRHGPSPGARRSPVARCLVLISLRTSARRSWAGWPGCLVPIFGKVRSGGDDWGCWSFFFFLL